MFSFATTIIFTLLLYPLVISACPNGYYSTPPDCEPCHSSCTSCKGPLETDCLICKPIQNTKAFYHTDTFICSDSCGFPSAQIELEFHKLCQPSNNPRLLKWAVGTRDVSSPTFTIGAIFTMLVSFGSPGTLTIGIFSELLYYIKYINVSHSADLETCFREWETSFVDLGFEVELPEYIDNKFEHYPAPDVLTKYGIVSNFFLKFWQNVTIWISAALLIILLGYFERQVKSLKNLHLCLQKMKISVQNLLLSIFYEAIGDIVFYSILEFRANKNPSDYRTLSLALAVCCFILLVIVLIMHVLVLCYRLEMKKKSGQQNNTEFSKKYESVQMLFKDLKEQSFTRQGFLLFFILREIIFKVILATLFEYPLLQTVFILALSCLMIVYFLIFRPLTDLFDALQILFCEASVLVVNIALLITAISDNARSYINLDALGLIIIILALTFNIEVLLYTIIKAILVVKSIFQDWRKRSKIDPADPSMQAISLNINLPTVQRFGPPQLNIPRDVRNLLRQSTRLTDNTNDFQTEASILRHNSPSLQPNNDSLRYNFDESPLNLSVNRNIASFGQTHRALSFNSDEVRTTFKRQRREG